LIGGQALDLEGRCQALELDRLEYIHSHKTGALFLCAAELGAMAVDARRRDLQAITRYAKNVGLAFQITDDLLDVEESPETTGKDRGQDADRQTFVTLLGVEGARSLASELLDFAVESLANFGPKADDLHGLARLVLTRRR
jgi:geranylgeranyl pyrophosphate synthase